MRLDIYFSTLQQNQFCDVLVLNKTDLVTDNEQSSLFSKEIEVMYDIEEKDVPNFIEKDLDKSKYTISNILGENYYEAK